MQEVRHMRHVEPTGGALQVHSWLLSGTKKQPKHSVFGQDIPRTSRRISGRTSRPKNFHPIARSAGKSSFFLRGRP